MGSPNGRESSCRQLGFTRTSAPLGAADDLTPQEAQICRMVATGRRHAQRSRQSCSSARARSILTCARRSATPCMSRVQLVDVVVAWRLFGPGFGCWRVVEGLEGLEGLEDLGRL